MSVMDLLPRHARVLLDLERTIAAMKVGDRLAPERELADAFKVSRETLRRAMRTFVVEGILEPRQGSGTFVLRLPVPGRRDAMATRLIGISVPTVEWPTIAKVVSGAEEAAMAGDYRVMLGHDHGRPAVQAAQIRGMLEAGAAGLIVFLDQDNVSRPECVTLLQEFVEQARKVVLVDRYVPGIPIPCVMSDNVRGMYEMTQHLIMAGRRRFGVLSWGEGAGIAERDRMTGFRHALRDHGLPEEPVLHAALGYAEPQNISAGKAVAQWLKTHGGKLPCDAILCFVDDMAYGAYLTLKAAGLRVPDDIALTGFDNTMPDVYRAAGLDLTTVEQPFTEIGRVAARRLLAMLDGSDADGAGLKHTLLPPSLIVRTSCGSRLALSPPPPQ